MLDRLYLPIPLLVITSCTGSKAVAHDRLLTLEDFRSPSRLAAREGELARYRVPAAELYSGEQHLHTMNGIRQLRERYGREAVVLNIVSAGYGLVPEDRPLAPYEATFQGMRRPEMRAWARQLGIAGAVREAVKPFPLVIFLLGDLYLRAVEPPLAPGPGQRLVFLAKPGLAPSLAVPGVTVVAAGRDASAAYGGYIGMKGRMFAAFARGLARGGGDLLAAVHRDDSPASFGRALMLGAPS